MERDCKERGLEPHHERRDTLKVDKGSMEFRKRAAKSGLEQRVEQMRIKDDLQDEACSTSSPAWRQAVMNHVGIMPHL